MTTPKPAPSKPLTFTPPVFLKGETKSSELPTVEGADANVISKRVSKYKKPNRSRADGFREANAMLAKTGLPEAKVTRGRQGARANMVAFDEAAAMAGEAVKNFNDSFDSEAPKKETKPEVKKPFVLNPHLTQRPFHDDRLMQLKSRLQRPSFKNR